MTIRHLKIFVTVCRCGSITGAAEKLYMTQPAVSLAIKELESNYGVRLFDRMARHIQITGEGKRLLEYALHITELFDDMERAMKNPDAGGELKIGSSLTIGACLLPGYADKLKRYDPSLKARVLIDNTESIIQGVLEGALDLGLVEGSVNEEALTVIPFMEDTLVAICGNNDSLAGKATVTLDDFLVQPLLLRERGSGVRELVESMLAVDGRKVEPLWESASTTALLRGVEAGSGVSILPERLVDEAIRTGRVNKVSLEIQPLKRSFYCIYHRKKYISKSIQRFMQMITESSEK